MVIFILVCLLYLSTYGSTSWSSFGPPFFTKVNQQHGHDANDETSFDADDYEPLPNDHFLPGPGLHEDGTLPTTLLNSIPYRANASDLVTVELLCILDDHFCSKVLVALKDAAQEFTQVVHLKTKLVIRAAYYEFCEHICANDTYGLGAPSSQFTLPFKDDDMNFIYPQALAKQLSPYEYTASWVYHDVMIELNHDPYMNSINHNYDHGNGIPPFGKYWFKGDPDIRPYQIDFEYILLHEILHGVGFVSSWAAYFANNASPFHTLLDNIFDQTELQMVTPSPYWSVQPPTGPTFVTGFQPTMIFDKFLFLANNSNNNDKFSHMSLATKKNNASLMDLGFTMQDFCVQGHEAFIIHFMETFKHSSQAQEARELYSMLTQEHALTFQFEPMMFNSSHSNMTYSILDYLNDTYTHMNLLTGEQTLNALNHHEQSGRLFRPGVTIAHVGDELQGTPDFIMTETYREGKTLQQWVDEVYATVPVIHYKIVLNESTTVERIYKSPIGPGILRILDTIGYVTILDHTNGTGNDEKQQPYNSMMKKTKNSHRNVCDDMHTTLFGKMGTKSKTPMTRFTSNTSKHQTSHLIKIWFLIILIVY
ncbi:uncharacterized protein BX664DRAFT_385568 [Halteromyces radiatus]|uniref:uncharacterized protein n=1 Tax=Halteromyces radiatus TaxID=101107 RepID=UPI00221EDDDB|nr:uncharacterized protein BX664DRAFT_385568 [Halteromyces radiatus]KAI8088992.1 hypothetical protein BX664DRAFT_385568 [Halteromyces radiatus]